MKDMEIVLLEKILKVCHTVTYQQIVSDNMSLDFHTIVLTKGSVDTSNLTVKSAGELDLAYRPQDSYYGGATLFVLGSDDASLIRTLISFSTAEVVSAFLSNMMKAMIRLSHDSDDVAGRIVSSPSPKESDEQLMIMGSIVDECSSRFWKMKHVLNAIDSKIGEFNGTAFSPQEKAVVEALGVRQLLERARADGLYTEVLWGRMHDKVDNMLSLLNLKMGLRGEKPKKGWF